MNCSCACHYHKDDGSKRHDRPCCDQPIGCRLITERPFYGAECPSYPNCSGGCGLGCTHNIEH